MKPIQYMLQLISDIPRTVTLMLGLFENREVGVTVGTRMRVVDIDSRGTGTGNPLPTAVYRTLCLQTASLRRDRLHEHPRVLHKKELSRPKKLSPVILRSKSQTIPSGFWSF
jgi:hypothetical protein